MVRRYGLGLLLAAVACAATPPVERPLVAAPAAPTIVQPRAVGNRLTAKVTQPGDQQCASSLAKATIDVLESPEFRERFLALGPLRARPDDEREMTANDVLRAFEGREVATGGAGPLDTLLVFEPREACADIAVAARSGDRIPAVTDVLVCERHAVMQLAPFVVNRWHSGGNVGPTVAKACAINTVAHELTHSDIDGIGTPRPHHRQTFTDRGYRSLPKGTRVASYTVGSVAQCVFMAKNGLIESKDVDDCVTRWGTSGFFVNKECQKFDDVAVGAGTCP